MAKRSREQLVEADRRHVWRPDTSSEAHETQDPFLIARAQGAWLQDADGRRYLDANASWWCNNVGHGHPRLRAALARQSESLMHCTLAGMTHEQAALLAAELAEVAPDGMDRVFYSDDGSTAVEVALKIAFQYWQQNDRPERRRFVALPSAYHGDTIGAMSIGGIDAFRGVFQPLMFDAFRPEEPEGPEGWEHVVESIERHLRDHGDEVAAVVVEPLVQGAAGMRMYPPELLKRLHAATRAADTFLIADEVFTGFGRTAEMWACDHAGVVPDLLCTAKGLSGGVLPFAATLATARVFDGFRGGAGRALMHGHTFCGNPIGAAIAREVLAIYRDEGVLEQARRKSVRIAEAFAALGEIEGVRAPRSLGMIGAAELGEPGYHGSVGWRVHEAARVRGAYLRPLGNTVYVCPALNIDDDDLETLLGIVRDSVAEAMTRGRAAG